MRTEGRADVSLEEREFRIDVEAEIVADQLLLQIEDAMKARCVNQGALASAMGCSASNVSQMLHGDGNFNLRTMVNVADALGCKLHLRLCSNYGKAAQYDASENFENIVDFPSGRSPSQEASVDYWLPQVSGTGR